MDFHLSNMAHKKEEAGDKLGSGCVVQGIGLGLIIFTFFTIIGPFIGLAMLVFGGRLSREKIYTCSHCGNHVVETSIICPTCNSGLEADPAIQAALKAKVFFLSVCSTVLVYFVYFYNP